MRSLFCRFGLAFFGVLLVFASAKAQDFQQSYKIGSNGSISIKNVSGDVSINGYEGDVVVVNGRRVGRDLEKVEIEDRSSGNRVDIGVRYPQHCNCDASVNFEVRVPRSTSVQIEKVSTASGNIEVKDVRGDISVSTASGNVLVQNTNGRVHASTASGEMSVKDVVGEVSAQSASGDVEVAIARLEGTENMKFSSASGDVNVRLPANVDADVSMTSASGDIKTDFPLQVDEQDRGPGSRAHGRLGSGARIIKISTASGDVSLMKY